MVRGGKDRNTLASTHRIHSMTQCDQICKIMCGERRANTGMSLQKKQHGERIQIFATNSAGFSSPTASSGIPRGPDHLKGKREPPVCDLPCCGPMNDIVFHLHTSRVKCFQLLQSFKEMSYVHLYLNYHK